MEGIAQYLFAGDRLKVVGDKKCVFSLRYRILLGPRGRWNRCQACQHECTCLLYTSAVESMRKLPNVIMPFPGGVVRSGSKVGSKYKALPASTNDAFCPTLRGITRSELTPDVGSVMEIVIDGLTDHDVRAAMKAGLEAVCRVGAAGGVRRISAGNYGGKLGPFHFHLREILA